MEKTFWKTTAIIFIVLFLFMIAWIGFGWYLIIQEENETYSCYYEICSEYPEADWTAPVCTCYDYDVLGDFVVAKEEYVK